MIRCGVFSIQCRVSGLYWCYIISTCNKLPSSPSIYYATWTPNVILLKRLVRNKVPWIFAMWECPSGCILYNRWIWIWPWLQLPSSSTILETYTKCTCQPYLPCQFHQVNFDIRLCRKSLTCAVELSQRQWLSWHQSFKSTPDRHRQIMQICGFTSLIS